MKKIILAARSVSVSLSLSVCCANTRLNLGGRSSIASIGARYRPRREVTATVATVATRVATRVATLRGGGGGIEENSEYDEKGEDGYFGGKQGDEDRGSSDDAFDDNSDEWEGSDMECSTATTTNAESLLLSATSAPAKRHRRSKSRKLSKSIKKRAVTFARRHHLGLYFLLAAVAFRRDIYFYVMRILPTRVDPETGRRHLSINWSTDVLKLIALGLLGARLFLPHHDGSLTANDDSARGHNEKNETEISQPPNSSRRFRFPMIILPLALLLLPSAFRRNFGLLSYFLLPLIAQILSGESDPEGPFGRILTTRMAYVPPLEQHYTFEQLNERYYWDWGAWRKAFPENAMVAPQSVATSADEEESANITGGMKSMISSIISGRRRPLLTPTLQSSPQNLTGIKHYPNEYNNGTVIVLDATKLDSKASRMETIRDQISFILHLVEMGDTLDAADQVDVEGQSSDMIIDADNKPPANDTTSYQNLSPSVEVVVLLESPGGGVSQYGLAASHLSRLRSSPDIKLTVCIDSIAASGGYMMACVASPGQLYCAPFAMVGSIGVIGQSLNFQKTLEGYGILPYVFRGGKMKNPVGMVGDVTKEGLAAMQDTIDRIHGAFRDHVLDGRREAFTRAIMSGGVLLKQPASNYFQLGTTGQDTMEQSATSMEQVMDELASGDVFLGTQALKLGLVDRLCTSDEYIAERIRQGSRVLKLVDYHHRRSLFAPPRRMGSALSLSGERRIKDILKEGACRMASDLMHWADKSMSISAAV